MTPAIDYMARTRAYYEALGYPTSYAWAAHADVPFHALAKPLSACRLALITTAAPHRADLPDQGPGAAYNAAAKFYRVFRTPVSPAPDLRISHLGYDRRHTTAADPSTWLPIPALERAVARGTVGSLAPELIGLPTDRSQRNTLERDAPDVLRACIDMNCDVALLVPT